MTLRLYDNTRISDYRRCPRYFMFRHELGWRTKGTRAPLVFGGAWHAAQEVIWKGLGTIPKIELAKQAHDAFVEHWCSEGMPHPSEIDYELERELSPRTPGRAFEMIVSYIDYRAPRARDFELVAVEQPFAVPMDPEDDTLFYVGKIDKIVLHRGKVLGIEHKTTTAYRKDGPFRAGFLDSFSPNSQVDGYLFALHMLYGPSQKVGGVWIDACLVHKQVEGFTFIPIERQLQHLDTWLWEARWWIGQIEADRVAMKNGKSEDRYLKAFPKNTNSCWDFSAPCSYIDLCKAWPNPVGKEPPPGYEVSPWDPLEHIRGLDEMRKDSKR